jgi:hypothetical protein
VFDSGSSRAGYAAFFCAGAVSFAFGMYGLMQPGQTQSSGYKSPPNTAASVVVPPKRLPEPPASRPLSTRPTEAVAPSTLQQTVIDEPSLKSAKAADPGTPLLEQPEKLRTSALPAGEAAAPSTVQEPVDEGTARKSASPKHRSSNHRTGRRNAFAFRSPFRNFWRRSRWRF